MSKKHLNRKLREMERQKEFELLVKEEMERQEKEKSNDKKFDGMVEIKEVNENEEKSHYTLDIQNGGMGNKSSF